MGSAIAFMPRVRFYGLTKNIFRARDLYQSSKRSALPSHNAKYEQLRMGFLGLILDRVVFYGAMLFTFVMLKLYASR
jgi:hypothetical protein